MSASGTTDEALRQSADLLTGASGGAVLEVALRAAGSELGDWEVEAVHRRHDSVAVIYAVTTGADGSPGQLVAHVSQRPVPGGAARVRMGDVTVHVWPAHADPYLPGLPSARSPRRIRQLLDRLGIEPGEVTLRTRSYRPTRRAVVEVAVGPATRPTTRLFLKVLGGKDREEVARRTTAIAEPHRQLRAAGLPVPGVIGVAASQGIVALTAVRGRTLHQHLLEPDSVLPAPGSFVELTTRTAAVPLETAAHPRRFAAAGRHVTRLTDALPDVVATIREIADEADRAGGPSGTVHGDLHDGQVLIEDGAISGLLDVDGAGPGLMAHDAGRLIAYVDAVGERGGAPGGRAAAYARDLFAAYEVLVPAEDLRRAVAGAWLSLATNPARKPVGDWLERTRARLDAATRWLAD